MPLKITPERARLQGGRGLSSAETGINWPLKVVNVLLQWGHAFADVETALL